MFTRLVHDDITASGARLFGHTLVAAPLPVSLAKLSMWCRPTSATVGDHVGTLEATDNGASVTGSSQCEGNDGFNSDCFLSYRCWWPSVSFAFIWGRNVRHRVNVDGAAALQLGRLEAISNAKLNDSNSVALMSIILVLDQ